MIRIEHMCFAYTGKQEQILRDINLNITQGEYISIIGENGCGKTTLMRIILGFLKPVQGSITVNAGRIGYVPQRNDFTNSNFPITVFEVMNSYRKLLKINNKEVIQETLQMVGMQDQSKALMGNLSGGQVQKILIARAMMGNPVLLLLDEPSAGVDVDSQREIYGIIRRMNKEQKITVIAVEHNLEAVYANSTEIFHLQNGHGHLCNPDKYAKEYLRTGEGEGYASI